MTSFELAGRSWGELGQQVIFVVFGGDAPAQHLTLRQVAARAVVVYVVGLLIVRVGKSRLLSRTTALDVILGFILGSLLSRGITGTASMSATLVASAALVIVHWLCTALACRSHQFGILLKGHARPIIENGRVDAAAMRQSHISKNDLIEELRFQGVDDVQQVKLACKERNGEISVVRRDIEPRCVEISVHEGVQTVRIELG